MLNQVVSNALTRPAVSEAVVKPNAEKRQGNERAPRPHSVTVWLASVAMFLSIASLLVAWRSSRIASDSLRISQQPYLSVRTNIFTVRGMRMFPNPSGIKPADNSPPVVIGNSIDIGQTKGDLAVQYEFEIENSGNTPAILEELALSFKMPEGWELIVPWTSDGVRLTKGLHHASITMEALSPKKSVQRAITIGLGLTEDARMEFLKKRAETSFNGVALAGIRGPVELNAELRYRDEIGQREPLQWCKVVQMNLPMPLNCIPGAVGVFKLW